jgi:hypothetical protein
MLHSISVETDGKNPLVLKESGVKWGNDGKTGTYGVTVEVK